MKDFKVVDISWYLWHDCNYRCFYCSELDEMDSNVLKKESHYIITAKKIKMLNRTTNVSILGGEPTQNPNLIKVLSIMDSSNIHLNVFTNCSASLKTYIEILELSNTSIQFSLHMDYFTDDDMKKINQLNKLYPKRIYVSIMIHSAKKHIPKLIEYTKFCINNSIHYVISYLMAEGCSYLWDSLYKWDYKKVFEKYENSIIDINPKDDPTGCRHITMNGYSLANNKPTQFKGYKCKNNYININGNGIMSNCNEDIGSSILLNNKILDKTYICNQDYCGTSDLNLFFPKYSNE